MPIARLQRVATKFPDSIALLDTERSISYSTLLEQVESVALALRSCGLSKGDRIAVIATKRIHTVCVILGAMRAGIIVVPVNPLLKPKQIVHVLSDCGACMLFSPRQVFISLQEHIIDSYILGFIVFTDSSTQHTVALDSELAAMQAPLNEPAQREERRALMLEWEAFLQHQATQSLVFKTPDSKSPAVILYTSGSTGDPKGVIFTHANLAFGASSVSQYLAITPDDRILALMPLSFDYGLSQLTCALHVGACVVLFEYYLPKGVIDAVNLHKITGLPAVPHVWDQLVNLNWPELPHLRYMTNTGGRMNETTSVKLTKLLPDAELFLMYGFTEAFRSTYLTPRQVAVRPRSIGKAVPHASVLVVDENGIEVPPNTVGELIHGGPLVAAGYWNDPELTRTKFRPRYSNELDVHDELFAWSGDLCTRDEDGFLFFISRRDDQLKLRGFRVNPLEIEEIISRCPQVTEVCVVCVPHAKLDSAALAVVVGTVPEITSAVEAYCRTQMPGYMMPHAFIQCEELPAGPNNKIDKRQLVQIYKNFFVAQSSTEQISL